MNSKIAPLIIIVVVIVGGLAGYLLYTYNTAVKGGSWENHQLLVIMIDDTEPQGGGGPGAVDMAYVLNFTNGSLTNMTPIYPGDIEPSNNISAPPDVPVETNLKLVDSFYWSNLTRDSQYAQEIVQQSTGIQTDGVVILKPAAVNAIISAIGPVFVNGNPVGNDSLTFVRTLQSEDNMTRGPAVEALANAIKNAATNNSKIPVLISTLTSQYAQGNLIVIPSSLFNQMVTEESLHKTLGI